MDRHQWALLWSIVGARGRGWIVTSSSLHQLTDHPTELEVAALVITLKFTFWGMLSLCIQTTMPW